MTLEEAITKLEQQRKEYKELNERYNKIADAFADLLTQKWLSKQTRAFLCRKVFDTKDKCIEREV